MSKSAMWPLQVGLVDTLAGFLPLAARLSGEGVFNTLAPAGTPKPYVTLGSMTEGNESTFSAPGTRVTQDVHIWTDVAAGNRDALQIFDLMKRALDGVRVPLTDFTVLVGSLTYVLGTNDPDGATFHGIARYEALTQEAA